MDLIEILKTGAVLIRGNSDDTTTGLDLGDITNALSKILSDENGSLDLGSLVNSLSEGGLGAIVSSWLGSGENAPISESQIAELLGPDKVSEFASQLNIPEESAAKALADALPEVVNEATPEGNSMAEELLAKIGGARGAMDMLGKMFG